MSIKDIFRPTTLRLVICLLFSVFLPMIFFEYALSALRIYAGAPSVLFYKVLLMSFLFIPAVDVVPSFIIHPLNLLTPTLVGLYYYVLSCIIISIGERITGKRGMPPKRWLVIMLCIIIFITLYYWFLQAGGLFYPYGVEL